MALPPPSLPTQHCSASISHERRTARPTPMTNALATLDRRRRGDARNFWNQAAAPDFAAPLGSLVFFFFFGSALGSLVAAGGKGGLRGRR